jgi:hypothetical protein
MRIGETERSRSELDARAREARLNLEEAGREREHPKPRLAARLLALVRPDARRGEPDGSH